MKKVIISMDKKMNFRAYTAITTEMVEEMRKIHQTTPTASAALGRLITCAAIMGLMLKENSNKLTIIVKGDGPAGQILTVSNAQGEVKGYIENPNVDVPLKSNGKLDVGSAVGKGTLTVIKDLGLKEPYVGKMELISGEIAEDITAYFAYSEQQPSSVMSGVLVDTDYSIKASGGCIIQIMPDAEEEVIEKLENMLSNLPSLTELISQVKSVSELQNLLFKDFDMILLDEKEVDYICDCSWERLERALISIGKDELEKIYNEDEQAELTCQFCLKKYHFDKEHLERLLMEARG